MGLSGLLLTSATGKKTHWTPTRPRFTRRDLALERVSDGSPAAPNAIACGNTVVPSSRMEAPRSKSPATIRGTVASRCILLTNAATWYG